MLPALTLIGQHMALLALVDDVALGQAVLTGTVQAAGALLAHDPGDGTFVQHISRRALQGDQHPLSGGSVSREPASPQPHREGLLQFHPQSSLQADTVLRRTSEGKLECREGRGTGLALEGQSCDPVPAPARAFTVNGVSHMWGLHITHSGSPKPGPEPCRDQH